MDLRQATLIRGWINHLEWGMLVDVAGEGGETPQRIIKELRRQLALKARFYEKSEWEALWMSERFPVSSWVEKASYSFKVLNQLPDPKPARNHAVSKWFSQTICQLLTTDIVSLDDVMDYLDRYYAGTSDIPEMLKPKLPALVRFFEQHETALGRALNRRPMVLRNPDAIIDRLTVIEAPHHSSLADDKGLMIAATNDVEAAALWLKAKSGRSVHTFDLYRREANRLLLWLAEQELTLSQLKVNHVEQYYAHLENPPAHWLRPRKPKRHEILQHTQVLTGKLSAQSINQTRTVLSLMCNYLHQAGYLKGNPFQLSSKPHLIETTQVTRWLDLSTWQWLWDWIIRLPQDSDRDRQRAIRTRWLFALLYHGGLRRSEVTHGKMADFIRIDDNWSLRIVGKGSKERYITVNSLLFAELMRYRNAIGLRGYPAPRENTPLIGSVNKKNLRKIMTPRSIGLIIEKTSEAAVLDCNDPQIAERIGQMTTHWLRHTNATHRLIAGASLETTQDELGHADPRTTRLYAKTTDRKKREDAEKLAELFAGQSPHSLNG